MAKVLKYKLPDGPSGLMQFSESVMTLSYGKCEHGGRAHHNLWFVKVNRGIKLDERDTLQLHNSYKAVNHSGNYSPYEGTYPLEDHIFFVEEQYANPRWFNEFRRDIGAWKNVCREFVIGDWDTRYERLWSENPILTHTMPNGVVVQYGYSPAQSLEHPERELWFIVFPGPLGFILDKEAVTPEFMNAVGENHSNWIPLCWCHLWDESEWLFLNYHSIHLDSPWSVQEIDQRLAEYRLKIQKTTKKKSWWWPF